MPNIASLKMQNPLAIPTFLAFSTQKTPTRFHEDRKEKSSQYYGTPEIEDVNGKCAQRKLLKTNLYVGLLQANALRANEDMAKEHAVRSVGTIESSHPLRARSIHVEKKA